jgi:ABC-type uncharacterized transport system involved in gliding motility auxiliary subunit
VETPKSTTSEKLGPLFGFLTLILLFLTAATFFINRGPVFWLFLALGIASLAVFVVLRRQHVIGFFISRQVRYGANVGLSSVLVVGVAVIVNAIVAQRFDKAADWTAEKLYTLSDQTKKILHGLERDVKAIAFFSVNSADANLERNYQRAKELLERYQRETNRLSVEFVDPFADALRRQEYEIEFDGTTVFESGNKRERVTTVDEQKFTSAIMKVLRDELKKVYFLTGHGERGLDDFDQRGYSEAKTELEKQNYYVESLDLATQAEIPADCAALIIASPKSPLAAHEVKAIAKYLEQNGKLLLMLDPSTSAQEPNQELVNLMDRWGVTIANDLVVDRIRPAFFLFGGNRPEAPTVSNFEFHQVTQYVYRQATFQLARSVAPKTDAPPGLSVQSLAKTTDEIGGSWGETARNKDGVFEELEYTPSEDTPPPVSLAVAIEKTDDSEETESDKPKETRTRLIVVGDSDFASNAFFHNTGGGDLFLNAVNWLTLEEDLIAIRPIDPARRGLRMLTPGEADFVQIAAIFLIPTLVFLIGVGVWRQRR